MKILLVSIHTERSPQAVPLACALLKGALLDDRRLAGLLQVEIVDFFLDDAPEECAAKLLQRQPDLVGFSVYVWSRQPALAIAADLRKQLPSVTVCAGGADPTAEPHAYLDSGNFDFVVRGEGEGSFTEAVALLVHGSPPQGIAGIVLPGDSGNSLPTPMDLAALPSPYLSGLLDPGEVGGALWQLSRGCDFACAFCFDHKGSGGVRRIPLARVEEELRLFARLRVPQVFVLDSTFNKDVNRAKEILRLIAKLAPEVHFHFEVRSEFIDPEMAELFASITCSLQIGLQSADPAVLRAVGRGFDAEDFAWRVSHLNSTGAIFGFDLIYGLPGDSLKLFRRSLEFALSLYPNHLDIFPLAVLPGTRLYGKAEGLGLKYLAAPPHTLISSPTFSADDLRKARELAVACDVFYSRGKAVAWFNAVVASLKFTPADFLLAFSRFLLEKGIEAEREIAEEAIWGLQREFLSEIFRERKKQRLLPLAIDLTDYHHHYASALLAAPPAPPSPKEMKKIDLFQVPLVLAPSAHLATFNYEILDILEAGEIELPDFVACFNAAPSCAVIYPFNGEVCTESLSKQYFDLLRALDGKKTAKAICRDLSLSHADARSFLEFAVSEGIVTLQRV